MKHQLSKTFSLHFNKSSFFSFQVFLHDALKSMSVDAWASQIRVGVIDVLQNRVGKLGLKLDD